MSKNTSITTGEGRGDTAVPSKPVTLTTTGDNTMREPQEIVRSTMVDKPEGDTINEKKTIISKGECDMDTASKIQIVTEPGVTKPIPVETVSPNPVVTNPSFGLPPGANVQIPTCGGNDDLSDIEELRVTQDFVEEAGTEKVHGTFALRKPGKEFFRVHPTFQWPIAVIEVEDEKDRIVTKTLAQRVEDEVSYRLLRLAVNKQGTPFLWPLKLSKDGRPNDWNESAMAAANKAVTHWVRLKAGTKEYGIKVAKADYGEPIWPELSFEEIMKIAFKGLIISDYNDPVLRQLRGEL